MKYICNFNSICMVHGSKNSHLKEFERTYIYIIKKKVYYLLKKQVRNVVMSRGAAQLHVFSVPFPWNLWPFQCFSSGFIPLWTLSIFFQIRWGCFWGKGSFRSVQYQYGQRSFSLLHVLNEPLWRSEDRISDVSTRWKYWQHKVLRVKKCRPFRIKLWNFICRSKWQTNIKLSYCQIIKGLICHHKFKSNELA